MDGEWGGGVGGKGEGRGGIPQEDGISRRFRFKVKTNLHVKQFHDEIRNCFRVASPTEAVEAHRLRDRAAHRGHNQGFPFDSLFLFIVKPVVFKVLRGMPAFSPDNQELKLLFTNT